MEVTEKTEENSAILPTPQIDTSRKRRKHSSPLIFIYGKADDEIRRKEQAETLELRIKLCEQKNREMWLESIRKPSKAEIIDIIWTKFNGDWELWSDHVTWASDDDESTPSSTPATSSLKCGSVSPPQELNNELHNEASATDYLCSLSPLVHQ